jgi:hypothetical protein
LKGKVERRLRKSGKKVEVRKGGKKAKEKRKEGRKEGKGKAEGKSAREQGNVPIFNLNTLYLYI